MRGKNSWSKVLKAKAVGFNCTNEGLILGRQMHSLFMCRCWARVVGRTGSSLLIALIFSMKQEAKSLASVRMEEVVFRVWDEDVK